MTHRMKIKYRLCQAGSRLRKYKEKMMHKEEDRSCSSGLLLVIVSAIAGFVRSPMHPLLSPVLF